MGKSIATNAGVMVYSRIYVERLCIFEVGHGEMGAQSLGVCSSARKCIESEECQHPQAALHDSATPSDWRKSDEYTWKKEGLVYFSEVESRNEVM